MYTVSGKHICYVVYRRFSGWVTRCGLLKRKQNGLTANSLFLFLAFSLRFLELALSYRVASGEMHFLELALSYRVATGEMRFLGPDYMSRAASVWAGPVVM